MDPGQLPIVLLEGLISGLWLMFPAFVAGPGAVFCGGGPPIDGGRVGRDGQRLLGDGKTWRGLLGGVAVAMAVGVAQQQAQARIGHPWLSDFGTAAYGVGFLYILFLLGLGSMLGDLAKSYAKRRLGKGRGTPLPLADQLDFLLGAWLLLLLGATSFAFSSIDGAQVLLLLLVTPAMHRVTNQVGFRMGRKKEPW